MGHGIETEVSDVGLFSEDEASEQFGRRGDRLRFGVDVYSQVDRFKEDRVLSIVVLDILRDEVCDDLMPASLNVFIETISPLASLASSQ
jgi:hypothetical protein